MVGQHVRFLVGIKYMADTRKELVTMLEAALTTVVEVRHRMVKYMIAKAKEGYYHDFKSKITTPKLQLIKDLQVVGLDSIANLVMEGEFDEDPDEDDKKEMNKIFRIRKVTH